MIPQMKTPLGTKQTVNPKVDTLYWHHKITGIKKSGKLKSYHSLIENF